MPVITFEATPLERSKKAELIREFTEVAHRITGIRREAFIVFIKDNPAENIGVGGEVLADRQRAEK